MPARFPSASFAEPALPTLPASYPRTRYLTAHIREREREDTVQEKRKEGVEGDTGEMSE